MAGFSVSTDWEALLMVILPGVTEISSKNTNVAFVFFEATIGTGLLLLKFVMEILDMELQLPKKKSKLEKIAFL